MNKKLIALVLAFALMFSTLTVAFADTPIGAEASVAVSIGMLKGDGNGVTPEYLATQPTRLQAAIMYLRLRGLEEEALAWTGTDNFPDAMDYAWDGGKAIMAYLKSHPELGWQGADGMFLPNNEINAQSFYKVMLEALGYKQNTTDVIGDFTWAGTFNYAADLGMIAVADVANFTVNDLAIATLEGLVIPVKNSEMTLAATLVEAGIIDMEAAISVGLYEDAAVVELNNAIADATAAIAALPAEITLANKADIEAARTLVDAVAALDAEVIIENIAVLEAAEAIVAELEGSVAAAVEAINAIPANVTLADKALVTSAREAVVAALELNAEAVIENIAVLEAAEAMIAELESAPATVESVTSTNLKELVVKFDKEVDKTTAETAGNYVIATSGAAVMGTAALQNDNKTVIITLATDANQQEAITLTVKNVKDAINSKAMETTDITHTFLDFTLPVAQNIELTGPTTFEITFSEPLDAAVPGTILVENGIYSATPVISGNKVTVTLGAALVAGSYSVKLAGYTDYAGLTMADKTFTLDYTKDTSAVVATVVEATQTYVIVEFNKAVDGQITAANFYHTFTAWNPTAVKDIDGNALIDNTFYKRVKLEFPDGGYPIPAGTTNLVVLRKDGAVNEVVDQWGNEMTEDAVLSVTVATDNTAPTVTKVEATFEDIIEVTFSEDVLLADAQTTANYTIKDASGNVVSTTINNIVYTSSDYKAVITLNAKLSGGNYTVEIKDIKDVSIAANKIATTSLAFLITDKTPATVTNAVVVETANDGNSEYIYITYSEAMATTGEGSILNIANYQLNGAAMPTDAKVEMFGSNKKVKVTVPDLGVAGTLVSAGPATDVITVGKLSDSVGNKMVAFSTPVTILADVAPVVTSVKTIALNKIEIVVNGILTAVPADGIKVDKAADGTTALAAVSFVTDETNNKTTITGTLVASENVADAASTVAKVEIVDGKLKTQTGKFMSAAADVIADSDPDTLGLQALVSKDGIAPSYSAIADGALNQFTVTFDEALVEIAAGLTATEFVIVDKDGKTLVANVDYTVAINGGDAKILDFTLVGTTYTGYLGKLTVSTKSTVMYLGDDSAGDAGAFVPGTDNAMNAFTGKEVTIQ